MLVSFIQGCYIVYLTFFRFSRELEDEETTAKPEREKEKEKKVIVTAPQEAIVTFRTNSLFFCVGVWCVR